MRRRRRRSCCMKKILLGHQAKMNRNQRERKKEKKNTNAKNGSQKVYFTACFLRSTMSASFCEDVPRHSRWSRICIWITDRIYMACMGTFLFPDCQTQIYIIYVHLPEHIIRQYITGSGRRIFQFPKWFLTTVWFVASTDFFWQHGRRLLSFISNISLYLVQTKSVIRKCVLKITHAPL
jgi:hypothetical protein